jgi:hypothetical protein
MIALLRYSIIVLSVGFWVIGWCTLTGAQTISSTELIQNGKAYDGKEIIYEGEAIGEVMKRKDGVWVNIYDKQNSIGVWMSPELASIIEYTGSYKAKGDTLRVRGIFNYNCPLHGGDLDIHASSLEKIKSGQLKQEKIIPTKRNLLIILVGVLCLILISRILITR